MGLFGNKKEDQGLDSTGSGSEVINKKVMKKLKFKIRLPMGASPPPESSKMIERYPLNDPFTYAVIGRDPYSSSSKSYLDEIGLLPIEAAMYSHLLDSNLKLLIALMPRVICRFGNLLNTFSE